MFCVLCCCFLCCHSGTFFPPPPPRFMTPSKRGGVLFRFHHFLTLSLSLNRSFSCTRPPTHSPFILVFVLLDCIHPSVHPCNPVQPPYPHTHAHRHTHTWIIIFISLFHSQHAIFLHLFGPIFPLIYSSPPNEVYSRRILSIPMELVEGF